MCRYLLFGFDDYYPSGGMNDLICKFNFIEEFELLDYGCDCDHYQLVDTSNYLILKFKKSKFDSKKDDDNYSKYHNRCKDELMQWLYSVVSK